MLKTHGRYDYSAITKRPDYSWPGGKRLAVHLSLNVEHFAFGEGLGNDYAAPHPQPNQRGFAWRDFNTNLKMILSIFGYNSSLIVHHSSFQSFGKKNHYHRRRWQRCLDLSGR